MSVRCRLMVDRRPSSSLSSYSAELLSSSSPRLEGDPSILAMSFAKNEKTHRQRLISVTRLRPPLPQRFRGIVARVHCSVAAWSVGLQCGEAGWALAALELPMAAAERMTHPWRKVEQC